MNLSVPLSRFIRTERLNRYEEHHSLANVSKQTDEDRPSLADPALQKGERPLQKRHRFEIDKHTFLVSDLKVRGRSPSQSIAPGRSMRASWVSSRQKFAPFSKDNGRAGCMCSTSILRSIRPRSMKRGSRLRSPRLAEAERTSRPASAGWTSGELCRRLWFSLQTCAAHSRTMLLPTLCCGPQRSRAGHHSGK
jgi:hypothetical protein